MGFAAEAADFASSYEKSDKALKESTPKASSRDTAGAGSKAAIFSATPERTDHEDKGYAYREGGIVKPVPWKQSKAKYG